MPAPAMLPLDLDVCQKASRYATRVCQEMTKRSSLIKDLKVDCLPYFERDEILPFLGDKLGKGGFNSVYELEKIELDESSNVSEEQQKQRGAVAHGLGRKLAVKFLNESAMANSNEFCNGAADLLLEAKYLSALSNHPHPSIISLHGVAAAGAGMFIMCMFRSLTYVPARNGDGLVRERMWRMKFDVKACILASNWVRRFIPSLST